MIPAILYGPAYVRMCAFALQLSLFTYGSGLFSSPLCVPSSTLPSNLLVSLLSTAFHIRPRKVGEEHRDFMNSETDQILNEWSIIMFIKAQRLRCIRLRACIEETKEKIIKKYIVETRSTEEGQTKSKMERVSFDGHQEDGNRRLERKNKNTKTGVESNFTQNRNTNTYTHARAHTHICLLQMQRVKEGCLFHFLNQDFKSSHKRNWITFMECKAKIRIFRGSARKRGKSPVCEK